MSSIPLYAPDTAVAARYGVHRVTVWKWVASKKFPAPVKLADNTTRWRLADIEAWEAERAAQRTAAK